MLAYVYVSESPYFGVTGADGRVRISGVPPGAYSVRVWHARLAGPESATSRPLTLAGGADVEISWSLALKRDSRVRRAPTRSGGGYR
jgi:hypothetical protein